ncbi:TonB-dependent receptor [Candidatus Nitrotoga sp. M5]|uniref:TonB-dependent receptor n=1 Tax=Candidatus Nitrotoga sp. M5 TaxID=2890409 RepID=UPI001EF64F73|nr:TonB-dependent receptor [Candidatus Nitrotoga sp. M5]CAH1387860.1 Iron complex outermembrane recepter protein [Candidatus Nitrotoga sp. M5]
MKYQKIAAAILCAGTSSAYAILEDPTLETIIVTGTRFKDTYSDKPLNVSIITSETINKSSARTIPELLSQQAGVSTRDLFGNNAALATVDLRGFGAAAGQNTLILLDGRRITNADSSGVQWSAIPFDSIERIEIMRGSGAVLYGDGATNGVINIITKSPTKAGKTGQVSLKTGSYGMAEVQANANYFSGIAGIGFTASNLVSDGYRANNRNEQTNVQVNTQWQLGAGELALKVGIDRQDMRLPGARLVQPSAGINLAATDPRGTATPLDYASRDGNQVALEWQQRFSGADINVGVARRTKNQKSNFDFNGFPNYRDSDLNVNSLTPRIKLAHSLGGDSTLVAGIDLRRWNYGLDTSNAAANIGQPINQVSMTQQNSAWYLQNTTHLSKATTLLAGVRNERISIKSNDVYNAAASGAAFGSAAPLGSFKASKVAYDLGLRHQLNGEVALNGKVGRGFRFANIDEIYESSPSFTNQFQFLRPQTSDNVEVSIEQRVQNGSWRAALFNNKVHNEIHLDPFTTGIGNTNLPPSRRRGLELDGKWQALPQLALNAAYTYIDAKFLSGVLQGGPFTQTNVNIAGKKVPLVPSHKFNLGAAWAITEQTLLNSSVTYVDSQFMDNDEANTLGIKIPSYTVADMKLVHKTGPWQLSTSVNNLFDRKYFNYAVSSQFTPGKYNAYPLPGRTLFINVSYQH